MAHTSQKLSQFYIYVYFSTETNDRRKEVLFFRSKQTAVRLFDRPPELLARARRSCLAQTPQPPLPHRPRQQ